MWLCTDPQQRRLYCPLIVANEVASFAIAPDDGALAPLGAFARVAAAFLDFIEGAELVIHNAPFDVGFIDAELSTLRPASKMRI